MELDWNVFKENIFENPPSLEKIETSIVEFLLEKIKEKVRFTVYHLWENDDFNSPNYKLDKKPIISYPIWDFVMPYITDPTGEYKWGFGIFSEDIILYLPNLISLSEGRRDSYMVNFSWDNAYYTQLSFQEIIKKILDLWTIRIFTYDKLVDLSLPKEIYSSLEQINKEKIQKTL